MLPTLAEPLPVIVIAEMLGVPEADHHLLRPWSADIVKMYELTPAVPAQRDAVRASVEFSDYLRGLARERRSDPGEDLISALVHVVDEGEHLTEDELVGTCVLLLNAGHEATVNSTLAGLVGALPASGPLEGAPRRPLAPFDRDRGAVAVPDAAPDVRAMGPGTVRAPWSRDPEGRRARLAVRFREPRPGRLRRSGRAPAGSEAEPAPHVRRGDPLLPGGAARSDGAPDLVPDAAGALPRPGARRGADVQAELHHPGARRPPWPRTGGSRGRGNEGGR